jgi:hypothetical protein
MRSAGFQNPPYIGLHIFAKPAHGIVLSLMLPLGTALRVPVFGVNVQVFLPRHFLRSYFQR